MKKLIASILIVLLMIPTVAFAESTHTLSELDLVLWSAPGSFLQILPA